jgi:hypothetical protein
MRRAWVLASIAGVAGGAVLASCDASGVGPVPLGAPAESYEAPPATWEPPNSIGESPTTSEELEDADVSCAPCEEELRCEIPGAGATLVNLARSGGHCGLYVEGEHELPRELACDGTLTYDAGVEGTWARLPGGGVQLCLFTTPLSAIACFPCSLVQDIEGGADTGAVIVISPP